MDTTRRSLPFLLACTAASFPCVAAVDLVPLVASGAVCAFMLLVVIVMLIIGFLWSDLRRGWQERNKKVKMPKAYFRKKEEAKKNLLNGSLASHSQSTYKAPEPNKTAETVGRLPEASWVQGWHQENPVSKDDYEEQGVTMELGDEIDKEFKIETFVVDNEVLDVGPYKSSELPTSAQPSTGSIYREPYIYTTGDRAVTTTKSSEESSRMANGVPATDFYLSTKEMEENLDPSPVATNIASSSRDEALAKL